MADAEFKDHFSSHAATYASYRPSYPQALIDFLSATAGGDRLALDCACGNGQLAFLLAERFAQVVGTDASETQIEHARPHPRIRYGVAPAHRSGLPAESADLITVAQAAHWLDLPLFYAEAQRVARPGALLALITYGVIEIAGPVGDIMRAFHIDSIARYGPPERLHVFNGYRDLHFPFPEIAAPALAIEASWALSDLAGYLETWSAVRQIEKAHGRKPVEALQRSLADAWGEAPERRQVRWPLSIRAAKL